MTASAIAPSFVPKLAKKARLRFDRHDARYMIVYPERGLVLNESAAAIAKKCDGSRTIAEIVDELAREYAAGAGGGGADGATAPPDRATIAADVVAFVEDLKRKGLLEAS